MVKYQPDTCHNNNVEPYPRTWAEIHFPALAHNLKTIRQRIGPHPKIGLVIKADAYGHGLVPIARFAARNGADWLCVAAIQEGVALRDAGTECPIMVMSPTLPIESAQAIFYNLDVFVESADLIKTYQTNAATQNRTARLHLKVDTGLHRFGCTPADAPALANLITNSPNLVLAGVSQHFLNSSGDPIRTEAQSDLFQSTLNKIPHKPLVHAANSAATAIYSHDRHDLVRVGMHAYGIDPDNLYNCELIPVLRWFARITSLRTIEAGETVSYNGTWQAQRTSNIATLGVGYGDGYARNLGNRSQVAVNGLRAPVIGLVCMDQMMVDVTDLPTPQIGDTVELLGQTIRAPELARAGGTNSHEIVCRIMTRVNRRYLSN
jgi:alanine racemase